MIYIDFETFSEADLLEVGAYRYAEHFTTEVLCVAWMRDGEEHASIYEGEPSDGFMQGILGDEMIVAHNAEFEKSILRHRFHLDLPIERFIDTATLAARMSLPRKLAEVAAFFKLDTGAKDAADVQRKGDSVCRPRKPSKANPARRWTPQTKPEAFAALYARCRQDVELTKELHRRLLPLEPMEREVWISTIEMNERGVLIDLDSIPPAKEVLDSDAEPLIAEFEILVGEKLKSYKKVAAALGMDDVRKPTVRKKLRDPSTPPATRRALEIYQALSKSSVSKLDAMLSRVHGDARVRGSFLYCGAERTGRWSSGGVQFQNFKRGLGAETEIAFDALHHGCLEVVFDGAPRPHPDPALTPTGTISEMLRGFITGPFYVGDLAQIEARGVAWVAGDSEALDLFRSKGDPYCAMASVIYGHPVTKKEKDKRFMGKQAELGCGYGLGSGGFQFMLDDVYDVQIEEAFSKQVVNAYRARHPKVVAFWERMGKAFVWAFSNKAKKIMASVDPNPRIFMGTFEHAGTLYAYVELPSGRRLYYADPQLVSTPRGPAVAYYGRDRYSKGWKHVHTYGGKLTENIVQALSRDVIAEALLRLRAAGYPLVMTVHDEIVAEVVPGKSLKEFHELMKITPKWAEGLPIDVDTFETRRYRK